MAQTRTYPKKKKMTGNQMQNMTLIKILFFFPHEFKLTTLCHNIRTINWDTSNQSNSDTESKSPVMNSTKNRNNSSIGSNIWRSQRKNCDVLRNSQKAVLESLDIWMIGVCCVRKQLNFHRQYTLKYRHLHVMMHLLSSF